jgi:nucleoside-triphosphatase THEP1
VAAGGASHSSRSASEACSPTSSVRPAAHRALRRRLAAPERLAIPAMEAAAEGEVAIIDELGKMELASRRSPGAVSCSSGRCPSWRRWRARRARSRIRSRRRSGIETLRLTRANRDDLAKALTDRVRSTR